MNHDGSDFDASHGVGSAAWLERLQEEAIEEAQTRQAEQYDDEPEPDPYAELPPLCYCGYCNGFHDEDDGAA